MGKGLSRRDLIRHGGTGITAVGIAGLAGCTGSIPFIGDDADTEAIGNWLVDPTFADIVDPSRYEAQYDDFERSEPSEFQTTFNYTVVDAVFDNAEELDSYDLLENDNSSQLRSQASVPASELDWQLSQSLSWDWEFTYTRSSYASETEETDTQTSNLSVSVIAGSFTPDDIEDSLENWAGENTDFTSEGEYEGYDFYKVPNSAFGVSEDAVVRVRASASDIDVITALELVIDANVDGSPRLTDSDDANELLSQFEQADINAGRLAVSESDEDSNNESDDNSDEWQTGLIGLTSADSIGGETTDIQTVYLYDSERQAVADDVEEYIDRNRDIGDQFATLEDYSVEEDGRAVVVSGTAQTHAYYNA